MKYIISYYFWDFSVAYVDPVYWYDLSICSEIVYICTSITNYDITCISVTNYDTSYTT